MLRKTNGAQDKSPAGRGDNAAATLTTMTIELNTVAASVIRMSFGGGEAQGICTMVLYQKPACISHTQTINLSLYWCH